MQFLDKELHIKDNRKLIIVFPYPTFFFWFGLEINPA